MWLIILSVFGLMLLGAVGAFLTGNIALAQALVPWLVAPFLLGFGIYVLYELLTTLEFIGAIFVFIGWCGRKVWQGVRFIFGFRSEPDSSPKDSLKQNDKSMQ